MNCWPTAEHQTPAPTSAAAADQDSLQHFNKVWWYEENDSVHCPFPKPCDHTAFCVMMALPTSVLTLQQRGCSLLLEPEHKQHSGAHQKTDPNFCFYKNI